MKNVKRGIISAIILLFLLYLSGLFVTYYSDWLWFKNLSYSSVFDTMILAKILSFILFFVVFLIFAAIQVRLAYKRGGATRHIPLLRNEDPRELILPLYQGKRVFWFWAAVIAFFGMVMASSASAQWNDFLQYIHATNFGIKEPVLGKDAGFYIFRLPVFSFLTGWYLFMVALTAALVFLSYYLDNAFGMEGNTLRISGHMKSHFILLSGFFALGIAALFQIKLYNLLYSSNGVAYGPSYMDVHAQIPAYHLIVILTLVISLLLFLYPLYRKKKFLLSGIAVWVLVWIGFVWIYPSLIEQYVVKPNELKKETPYILNNIKLTREAFGLNKIKVKPFPVKQDITYQDILENSHTINNIRLWDRRPLIQTYKQLQEIRLYYDFSSVQVDRYHFKKYTQVALGARELPLSEIPARARTWVNDHLIYTHGYGVVMSPVNKITPNGMPDLIVKDIPPVTTVPLQLKQMGIYYGEETNQYVIVNTKAKEFDYPKGNQNVYTSYKGKGGVRISSLFRRLVYAWKFSDIKILLTGYITNQSRIMFYRNIALRDKILAPFLSFDSQPYPVVGKDGKLYWIHDAYTTTNMFPYSEPVYQNPIERGINYIRNSVKVVIDAYNGNVTYYVIDPKDPIIRTFEKIYPKLFKPYSAMPDFLKAHIRYPTDLFTLQVKMYNVYHMTDPKVFYNQEDFWQIPNEVYSDIQQKMFPYYIIMRLPGTKKEEFILMIPLTPSNKDNMVAWMCARCDAPNYGKLIVYSLPKDKLIYGPMQIEARINQKPDISSELTLWGQQGSQVIKGNQLVIPVKNSFLYVEPVYLQSEQGQIPELKRVIVAYKEQIEMRRTLDQALKAVFQVQAAQDSTAQQMTPAAMISTGNYSGLSVQAQQALQHYNKALEYLKEDNWSGYGKELQKMKDILSQMAGTKNEKSK
ncbi:UPF0182 family protein [Candidatus Sulfidibacterium hydrothermale]|uniref:UPF0182 family membrane protein n=1 Tax=Candidatus Sulfidibacterium hydrothermale TaxID=2875962 RepID=UPI001F0A2126|nr:UPF0182 family protein [Candidatus Sulfidibacterium hydrothermale]UBM62130.1 UPF0182 family protein [Candidatus Sulfidibacterium hydrothermale]